jgi:SNF2 family DNA or RNA helicase
MLRRTKNDTLNGKPLLDLPERLVENVHCEFDAEERAFYDSVQERVQTRLETLQQQGGAAKNYTSMLVLLLRLRQGSSNIIVVYARSLISLSLQPPVARRSRLSQGQGGR